MNFCVISPVPGLRHFATLSTTHLVLSHITHSTYMTFYRERRDAGDTLILDNSAYERKVSSPDRDLEYALMFYQPQICILPDKINDPTITLSRSLRFLDKNMERFREVEWMFVVHQKPKGDYLESVVAAVLDRRVGHSISWLGIPRCLTTDHKLSRAVAAKSLTYEGLKFHALGMVDGSIGELLELREAGFASVDSSAPVWRGWMGHSLRDRRREWSDIPCNFTSPPELSPVNRELILHNLEMCGVKRPTE